MVIPVSVQRTGAGERAAAYLLAAGILLAWLLVLATPADMERMDGMETGAVAFVLAWTVMMSAMMLPSAAPLVLLYRRGAAPAATLALAAGYIALWGATGVPAFLAHQLLPMSAAPVALAAAGLYQLTPLKLSCLRRCRGPADFLMQHWGRHPLRLGLEHGAWCVGCCWALMLVLVLAGSMSLPWVIGIAAVVAVEKLTRHGVLWSRCTGVALLLAAILHGGMSWPGN